VHTRPLAAHHEWATHAFCLARIFAASSPGGFKRTIWYVVKYEHVLTFVRAVTGDAEVPADSRRGRMIPIPVFFFFLVLVL